MVPILKLWGAAALAGALAAPVQANPVPGRPIVVKQNDTIVTVEFVSADPDRIGNLYFRGSGDRTKVLISAPSTDDSGLGQFLFGNESTLAGQSLQLVGTFNAGDKLHFAFDLLEPQQGNYGVFRSNKVGERKQFAWDKHTGLLHIDDGKRGTDAFDGDYDDLIVRLTFSVIPEPGSMALLGLSAVIAIAPRRRSQR